MLHFLLIFTAIFAVSIANETIRQLKTIKESLDKQETVFSNKLPTAEAASHKKYAELSEKFKQFEEQCKTLDTLMRKEFSKPNLLINLYPARKFYMNSIYKEETICDDFLKLDPHMRFERDSRYDQLYYLRYKLDDIEKRTNVKSEEMQLLVDLKNKRIRLPIERYDKIGEALHEVEKSFETLQNGNKEEEDIHADKIGEALHEVKKSFETLQNGNKEEEDIHADKIGEALHEVKKSFETLQNGNKEEEDIHADKIGEALHEVKKSFETLQNGNKEEEDIHADKIGEALHEVKKSFETFQNGNKEEENIHAKQSFIEECKALKWLIMARIDSKDKVLTEMKFLLVESKCKAILEPNVDEKEIEDFKKLLQEIKEIVGSETHLKLPEDAKEKLILETAENLIETYRTIGKANAKLKNTLQECQDLYSHHDINSPIQIKYFAELTKIGQKFVENLKEYFHNGHPAAQLKALKAEKDELSKKLTFEIRYNGKSEHYFGVHLLEHFTVVENRKGILDLIKKNLILPEILDKEKEIIVNAENTTMVNAMQVLKVYKQKIDEEKKLAENSPTFSNGE